MLRFQRAIVILMIFLLCACSNKMRLNEASYAQLNDWDNARHDKALDAFRKSCQPLLRQKNPQWQQVCRDIPQDNHHAKAFFEQNFTPFAVSNNGDDVGLFTGYFVPELSGSRSKSLKYQYPIYQLPDDDKLVHLSRLQIEQGGLLRKNLQLFYVANKVDLFFMHIQGSGRIRLENGEIVMVGYAGQNGHQYISIGKYMIENGLIRKEDVTAQSLKKWLRENPDKIDFILNQNPSYIYFRMLTGEGDFQPVGGQGVELTPFHSLAIDKRFIAYGTPVYLQTQTLAPNDRAPKDFNQLLIAQDTGGAIKGIVRGDIFFGAGKIAQYQAGKMNFAGSYFLLLPKLNDEHRLQQ